MNSRPIWLRLATIAGIGACTLSFMLFTVPADLPAMLLILPFVGIFSFLYLLVYELLRWLGPDEDENGAIVQLRRPRLVAAVVAGFPSLLLVLQSVVELTVWDVLIALLILALAYIYISRGSVTFRK